MTPQIAHDTCPGMARKKVWTHRLTLPLTQSLVDQMDAALEEGEARLDLIRDGIRLELARRQKERARATKPKPD